MEYRPRIPHCSFDLANSFHGNCCISKTISARRSSEVAILHDIFKRGKVGKVERAHFHAFSSHFLKVNPFSGGSCVGVVGVFGPKGVFGCLLNVQKVS